MQLHASLLLLGIRSGRTRRIGQGLGVILVLGADIGRIGGVNGNLSRRRGSSASSLHLRRLAWRVLVTGMNAHELLLDLVRLGFVASADVLVLVLPLLSQDLGCLS